VDNCIKCGGTFVKRLIITLMILAIPPFSGFSDFAPWQKNQSSSDDKKGTCINCRSRGSSVINGFQGGAYLLVRFFQIVISPQDGPNCRHTPVCSAYARIAVEKHGAFKGSLLAGDRLLRCNPFSYLDRDPVPDEVLGE